MKLKTILTCITLALPLGGNAEAQSPGGKTAASVARTDSTFCVMVTDFAESMMRIRQLGGSRNDMLHIARGNTLMTEIAMRAMDRPVARSEIGRQTEIDAFRSYWRDLCVETLR